MISIIALAYLFTGIYFIAKTNNLVRNSYQKKYNPFSDGIWIYIGAMLILYSIVMVGY